MWVYFTLTSNIIFLFYFLQIWGVKNVLFFSGNCVSLTTNEISRLLATCTSFPIKLSVHVLFLCLICTFLYSTDVNSLDSQIYIPSSDLWTADTYLLATGYLHLGQLNRHLKHTMSKTELQVFHLKFISPAMFPISVNGNAQHYLWLLTQLTSNLSSTVKLHPNLTTSPWILLGNPDLCCHHLSPVFLH